MSFIVRIIRKIKGLIGGNNIDKKSVRTESETKSENASDEQIDLNNFLFEISNLINEPVPNDEIKILMERAYNLYNSQNFDEALKLLNQLIERPPGKNSYLEHCFSLRSSIYSSLSEWDKSIDDLKNIIDLNPDADGVYLSLGAIITFKLFYSGDFRIDRKNKILEDAIFYYKKCLERNPTNSSAWLNIVETFIFLQNWDDAISYYGLSKPYMDSPERKLVRAWLGCLSFALAGEIIENEDIKPLLDESVKIDTTHDPNQIRDVLSELERIQFDLSKLDKAKYIHNLFMSRINYFESH